MSVIAFTSLPDGVLLTLIALPVATIPWYGKAWMSMATGNELVSNVDDSLLKRRVKLAKVLVVALTLELVCLMITGITDDDTTLSLIFILCALLAGLVTLGAGYAFVYSYDKSLESPNT